MLTHLKYSHHRESIAYGYMNGWEWFIANLLTWLDLMFPPQEGSPTPSYTYRRMLFRGMNEGGRYL